MLFCDSCGSLKKAIRRRGDTRHVCPKCDGVVIPPGGTRPGGRGGSSPSGGSRPSSSGSLPSQGFQRADTLQTSKPGGASEPPSSPVGTVRTGEPPEGAGRYFPFPSMRPGQADFIQAVRETLEDQGVLVAQVPTGLGKTAGALAPALEVAKKTRSRIFFLTPKQSQHKVVVDTLKLAGQVSGEEIIVSDMISKQAMCPRPESNMLSGPAFGEWCTKEMTKNRCSYYKADESEVIRTFAKDIHHVDKAVSVCEREGVCPYAALTEVARVANVVVLDYNHFFSDMLENTLDRLRISLDDAILVIDEAHNLPDRIRDHLTSTLHPAALAQARDEARSVGAYGEAKFLENLRGFVEKFDGQEERELRVSELLDPLEELLGRAFRLGTPSVHDIIDQLKEVAKKVLQDEARSACEEVAEFLEVWPGSRRIPEKAVLRRWSPDHGAIVHQVLDASVLARPIFDQVRGAVLMSGTLFPMEMYSQVLGVPEDRARHELYPNPFPRENRQVVIDTSVSSSYRERGPQTYRRIAERVQGVCQATPGNVAAFFPSYSFLERVLDQLPNTGRLMVNEERGLNKQQKESLVTQIRRADGNALLMGVQGGSLSEGYDFVEEGDNLLDAVLVVGIPYAPPTLEVKSLQAFYDHAFGSRKGWLYGYLAPAMQKVLQAAGRAVRAPHHRAFVGLLDHRYTGREIQQWLPPDVQPLKTKDAAEQCRAFFG